MVHSLWITSLYPFKIYYTLVNACFYAENKINSQYKKHELYKFLNGTDFEPIDPKRKKETASQINSWVSGMCSNTIEILSLK